MYLVVNFFVACIYYYLFVKCTYGSLKTFLPCVKHKISGKCTKSQHTHIFFYVLVNFDCNYY